VLESISIPAVATLGYAGVRLRVVPIGFIAWHGSLPVTLRLMASV
jgi:hypothetical protein